MQGTSPSKVCGRCDSRFVLEVRRITDPDNAEARSAQRRRSTERRAAAQAEAEHRQKADLAARELDERRREAIRLAHPIRFFDPRQQDWDQFRFRFGEEVGLLTLLDYAPSMTPLPPPDTWDQVLCPSASMGHDLVATSYRLGLLRIHPDATPTNAFVWADDEPERLTDQFYPSRVHWYAWWGSSMGTAAETTQRRLRARTAAWLRTEQGVRDVCDLSKELIAAETVRYLLDQLDLHNLPEVPGNHASRLWESASRLAERRSLGECYSIAWRAARNAASVSKQRPYAPAANMTTHAVNWFESTASGAATDLSLDLPVYREDTRAPLSALTRTLFLQVLDRDPMTTSVPRLRVSLQSQLGFPRPLTEMVEVGDQVDLPASHGPDHAGESTASEFATATSAGRFVPLLADALDRLSGDTESPSMEALDDFLMAGPETLTQFAGLAEPGSPCLEEAFERIRMLRQLLEGRVNAAEARRTLLTAAFLQPGVVRHAAGDGEVLLGELMGGEVEQALRAPALGEGGLD